MKKFIIPGLLVLAILAGLIFAKVEKDDSTDNLPELIEQVEADLDSLKSLEEPVDTVEVASQEVAE